MIGAKLGHYRILAKIGEGGMGEVFRAEDTVLKREVALKVLPAEWSNSPERLTRFRREAESLASLNHPAIVTIYSVETATLVPVDSGGDVPEIHFLTMELVEGDSLSRTIPAEGLALDRFFGIAIPLIDAISAAHHKGVVHRDLKPGNIMITEDGRVKVLDFGLAKIRGSIDGSEWSRTVSETLTVPGEIVGTVPYMSPEQLQGLPADFRSDLFALGVVLYEMASGTRPFRGDTPISMISSIVKDTPTDIAVVRADLPKPMARIIAHCLEKNPADRPPAAAEVGRELRALRDEIDSRVPSESRKSRGPVTSRLRRRKWTFAAVLLLFVLVGLVLVSRQRGSEPMLDFAERDWVLLTEFLHPEGEAEVADALALALRVGLEESGYVNVVPQTRIDNVLSLMRRDRTDRVDLDLGREICRRGGVKAMLTPELARVGNEYLVTLSLIHPASGDTSASFSERAGDQSELLDAMEILVERLRRGLGESLPSLARSENPLDPVTTASLDALVRYSKGRRDWYLGEYRSAVELFREAVEIDPQFASAHAALGNALASYLFNDLASSRQHYDRALSLLDRVGERERYFIEASYQSHFGEPQEAIQAFKQYLDRYPDDGSAFYNLGGIFREIGDCENAIRQYRKVLEIDPDSAGARINTATCMARSDPEEAVLHYRDAFRIRPEWEISGNLNHEYGITLLLSGDEQSAREAFEKRLVHSDPIERGGAHRSLGLLSTFSGQFRPAAEHFESATLLHDGAPASGGRDRMLWALAENARGNTDRAVELLEEADPLIPLTGGWLAMRAMLGTSYLAAGELNRARRVSEELDSWASENDETGTDPSRRREILAARLMAVGGEVDRSLEVLDGLRRVEQRDNPYLEEAIAEVCIEAGRWQPAEEALDRLLELRWIFDETQIPWIEAHFKRGRVLDHLGRSSEAESSYRRFLEIWGDADSPIAEVEAARRRLQRGRS